MVTRNDLPLDDVRCLVESGDIKLKDTRSAFNSVTGKATTLSDDDIMACHAAQDDDYGIADVVNRMIHLQAGNEALAFTKDEASKPSTSGKNTKLRIAVTDSGVDHGYEYGSIRSDKAEISRYFRLCFNDENPEPWKHADDVIIDIINRNPQQPGQEDEDYNSFILEQMAEFEPQELPDATALQRIEEEAKSFDKLIDDAVRVLDKDQELTELFTSLDEAKKTEYMGPVHVHLRLKQMVEDVPELWALLPEPGTTQASVIGSNEPYDKYPETVTSKKGKRVKMLSRIDQIAGKLSLAMAAKKESNEHKAFIAKKEAMGSHTSQKRAYDMTVSVIRRHFSMAVSLLHRFKQAEALTLLNIRYYKSIEAKVKNEVRVSPTPIAIMEIGNEVEAQGAFSCSQFRAMNIREALKNGGTFKALKASMEGRETGEPETYKLPKNMAEGEDMLNTIATYFLDGDTFKLWLDYMTKAGSAEARSACKRLSERLSVLAAVKQPETSTRDKLIAAAQQRANNT